MYFRDPEGNLIEERDHALHAQGFQTRCDLPDNRLIESVIVRPKQDKSTYRWWSHGWQR
jgi:hypothetical protein